MLIRNNLRSNPLNRVGDSYDNCTGVMMTIREPKVCNVDFK